MIYMFLKRLDFYSISTHCNPNTGKKSRVTNCDWCSNSRTYVSTWVIFFFRNL